MVIIILAALLSLINCINKGGYNYPLLIGQPNTIMLSQYTPKSIQAPYYQIEDSNEYNLEIQQSILPLFNQVINSNETFICFSNYVIETGLYSNHFWVLSNSQILSSGIIDRNGSINIQKIDIQLYQLECYQINLITNTQGVLTCLNQTLITFLIINSTSLEQTIYITNQSVPFSYFNFQTTIQTINYVVYYINLSYMTLFNARLVTFKYYSNNLEFLNSQSFQGTYYQIQILQQYLFLLDSISIQILEIQNYQKVGDIQISNSQDNLQYMAVCLVNDKLFRIAILETLQLSVYYFNPQNQIYKTTSNPIIINPYQNFIRFDITSNSIYIITNNYIMKIDGELELNPQNFLPLSSCFFSSIQFDRQIVITQQQLNGQSIFSTFLINSPQIQITINQTLTIKKTTQSYLLKLLIKSQTLQQIKDQIYIWIMPQNFTNSQCPIPYQHFTDNIYINFPDQYNIPFTEVFQGPNLTQKIISLSPSILYVDTTSNYIKFSMKSNQVIFLEICSIFDDSAIYCSQFKNQTIEISYWNPYFFDQNIQISSNSTLKSCQCFISKENINVLIQLNNIIYIQKFNFQSQPQNLLEFAMPIQILSSTILKQVLFIITVDGNLMAFTLQNNQTSIFTVSNYSFNYIYTNLKSYPNFLFIDNKVNLIIISYKGQQSYEILNYIQYPVIDYNVIQIGILKTGIYMALQTQAQDQLYFYPIQYLYFSNSEQLYYQIDLLGYNFQNGQIISSYTSIHFYLILQNINGIFCAYFSGSQSPFNSFVYANMIFFNSQNISILQMSVIQKENFHIELVQLFTNTSQAINGTVLYGEFQMVPYYQETQYSYAVSVFYQANNSNCSLQIKQQVHVLFERSLITQKQFNSETQILTIQNSTKLTLNPSNLFNGNIQSYAVYCKECRLLNFTQPIDQLSSLTFNFSFQAAVKHEEVTYIQNNFSLYQINTQSGIQNQLYSFPYQNNYCYVLFIDKYSQFPVSICSNTTTTIYAYNKTLNGVLKYNFSQCQNFYKASYNNGVLQVLTVNYKLMLQTYSYYAFYFWINNNTINLSQIYNVNNLCNNSYLEFIYINMSINYSTQPCQIFGFTSLQKSGTYNPIFYILKTCISSQIIQYFGFTSDLETQILNIYFQTITWNLYQTLPIYFKFISDIQQYQNSKSITENLSELQFIVPLTYSIEIYGILFNTTKGTILGFRKKTSLFLSYNQNVSAYFIFQGIQGLLINLNFENQTCFTINVYPNCENNKIDQQPIQIIGQEYHIQQNYTQNPFIFAVVSENQLFLNIIQNNQTIMYPVQNELNIDVDISGIEQAQIQIIASNQQSISKQTLFLLNGAYDFVPYEKQKQDIGIYIGLFVFILIIIIIITVLILRYYKDKKSSITSSKYFELENKQ
ncbi:unnamed protein product [Paramecium sonneborni]|uniref:Transmembrane protein n=1 Tax=Paramecium sonneborni TaxID=65129 RepID=A0A8S1MJ43_9CILI|nr:unnamed protein product [Paramecium sonneborni]